ncbi:DNA replication and repair protein RecN [Alkalibacterium putridalgicola]|uniref:DNA repair protein RecN n=1 Tax=Alkalibacterium putridalgicola TaxID=426703 RepID=A0A1H7SG64_9LACT|nr:DNA repair protein RecN [Alkalibacterium putridalgicola]GEK88765.1 DNA repair protein RecN [Alkalibacterium putridalgicola]SEL71319.1 DNA replication and repair protein RecN [Alkalibacterium putridalgicola]
MLESLRINNFAIIEELFLDFKEGMTVLTGETGAGKSIIIDAVGLLAGGRGSTEFVRFGSKKCVLEGEFSFRPSAELMALFSEHEIEHEANTLLVQREIFTSGRTVCRINGSIVTIAVLKEIGSHLIDIHGQNEHQELMVTEYHSHLLDYFGPKELLKLKKEYQDVFHDFKQLTRERDQWVFNEQELAQRLDILRYQVDEIEAAQLHPNEEEELLEEEKKLANHQAIVEALSSSYAALQGEEYSGLDSVGQAMEKMAAVENIDESFKQISESLSTAFFQLQEAASDIYSELDGLEYDEERLNEIETRLNFIQQLKRKYGNSVEAILDHFEKSDKELKSLENREEQVDGLSKKIKTAQTQARKLAEELSAIRKETAVELENSIQEQLKELYMEKVKFQVAFKGPEAAGADEPVLTEQGIDKIEFFVSTNPGEPLKALSKVASGGELSRMMLAMKTIFSQSQGITSIIFDEVDTGVSGRVAQAIADKIYSVAKHSQVLCITHLPQVAAMADQHLYIKKTTDDERTQTSVERLMENDRVEEIARMLSGDELTQLTKETASELLKLAGKKKERVKKK